MTDLSLIGRCRSAEPESPMHFLPQHTGRMSPQPDQYMVHKPVERQLYYGMCRHCAKGSPYERMHMLMMQELYSEVRYLRVATILLAALVLWSLR